MEKTTVESAADIMMDNDPYKTSIEKGNECQQDIHEATQNCYYDIPAINTNQGPATRHISTPTPSIKQSDNPLYSSTQELKVNVNYDNTVLARSRSTTPKPADALPMSNTSFDPHYSLDDLKSKGLRCTAGNNNHLSYGLELEMSNKEIHLTHTYQHLVSYSTDPVYTEL